MQVFKSKVDMWLAATIGVSVVFCLGTAFFCLLLAHPVTYLTAIFLIGVGAVMPLWLMLSLRYCVDQQCLTIRCGPFLWRVSLASISAVTPSRSVLSSPALSMDRLAIAYDNGKVVMVSPSDKKGFLKAIGQSAENREESKSG